MISLDEAHAILSRNAHADAGSFYGARVTLSLGAGLFFEGVRCPQFNVADQIFDTFELPVYVLTHECDVDPENRRPFNDALIVCPVISMQAFLDEAHSRFGAAAECTQFLANVARRHVSRLVYLPPTAGALANGGFIYLNALTSTHVSVFERKEPFAALSATGLREVDFAVQNHLLRPKAESLSAFWGQVQ